MNEILSEFQELKKLTLLSAKQALTMDDAVLLTGLSKSHLYKMVSARKIPYFKSKGGKITYFDRNELNSYLLNTRVKTADELDAEAENYVMRKGGLQ